MNPTGDIVASTRGGAVGVRASVRVLILQAIIQNLADDPSRLKALLTRHGLTDARIGNPNARVDMRDYLAFFEDAAVSFGDPVLGARLGTALRPGDIWPMGILLMQAGSIASALGYIARYSPSAQSATSFPVQLTSEGLLCGYRVHADIRPRSLFRQDNEFTLSCIFSQLRAAFDRDWKPIEIRFEHSSNGHDAMLERIFHAPVRFDQPRNCIVIDPRDADRQYRAEDRELIGVLNQHMASLIAANNAQVSASEQVKALISVRLGLTSVELPALAAEMAMTPRSLQRRLRDEGTSLRDILQTYREQLATAYLAQANMSLEEISAALGYAEATVFSRAFKTWTGTSPANRIKAGKRSLPLGKI